MPQAVRRVAATAEVQHSFSEACVRYVGVAGDQGWGTAWTAERVSWGDGGSPRVSGS